MVVQVDTDRLGGNGANGSRPTIDTGSIIGGMHRSPKLIVSDPGDSEKES